MAVNPLRGSPCNSSDTLGRVQGEECLSSASVAGLTQRGCRHTRTWVASTWPGARRERYSEVGEGGEKAEYVKSEDPELIQPDTTGGD